MTKSPVVNQATHNSRSLAVTYASNLIGYILLHCVSEKNAPTLKRYNLRTDFDDMWQKY